VCTVHKPEMLLSEAIAHIPTGPSHVSASFFPRDTHEPFVPDKENMDPDKGNPEAPLVSIKVTLFPSGGTAIGILLQHGVCDADAGIAFVRNWSRVYRGLAMEPAPIHDRGVVNHLVTGDLPFFKLKAVPPGEQHVPEFMAVMPKIMGPQVCVVPFSKTTLQELKETASTGLKDGQYVSVDDVITAHVWRALCAMRCTQLDLATDSKSPTTIMRACIIRKRTEPQLGAGYFGNGVTQAWTELTVHELLTMTPAEVALRLRATLEAHTPTALAALGKWQYEKQQEGCRTTLVFDPNALTFVLSSWVFDWEGADFDAKPVCYDHGALTPVVAVFTPRPLGDGLNVYASGPQEALDHFVSLLPTKK